MPQSATHPAFAPPPAPASSSSARAWPDCAHRRRPQPAYRRGPLSTGTRSMRELTSPRRGVPAVAAYPRFARQRQPGDGGAAAGSARRGGRARRHPRRCHRRLAVGDAGRADAVLPVDPYRGALHPDSAESQVRRRVRSLAGVELLGEHDIVALVTDDASRRVIGAGSSPDRPGRGHRDRRGGPRRGRHRSRVPGCPAGSPSSGTTCRR